MQAVVPVAGAGTRLRPLTETTPKALLEVAGKPILTRCFEALAAAGASEFVVVVGYRGEDVVDRYGEAFRGTPITYVHQPERRGLGDAVRLTEPAVDGPFLVCNGDNVVRANLAELVERHRGTDAAATLLVEEATPAEAATTGVCVTDDEGRLETVVEKPDDPPSNLVLTGCFAFDPIVFHACHLLRPSDRGEYELADAIDLLLRAGWPVETVELDGWRVNVNTPADLEAARQRLE